MGKFRIKWGENEIEYEGENSNLKYAEALATLKQEEGPSEHKKPSDPTKGPPNKEPDKSAKGLPRKGIFAPEIVKLVDAGFFKLPQKRSSQEVQEELHNRGIPTSGKNTQILMALKRLLRSRLKGTKTKDGWVFWQE
jgi:hypothetical protein